MKLHNLQKCLNTISQIFSTYLQNFLPYYEPRFQQLSMAQEIFSSMVGQRKIIAEAPTGVGKSLGYLIAAIVYQQEVNVDTRIVVSTYTKTLQQQLIHKDLPVVDKIVQQLYKRELNYGCFYGSENYICLNKFNEYITATLSPIEKTVIAQIEKWLQQTQTGCIEEIDINLDIWQEINREPDLCRGKHCKFYSECLYYKCLNNIKTLDIIVVNHHLFFAHIVSLGKLIPLKNKYCDEIIIFDEAHNIEDVALQWLGNSVSNTQIKYLLKRIFNPKKHHGLVYKLNSVSENWKENVISCVNNLYACCGQFFSELASKFPDKKEVRVVQPNIVEDVLTPALSQLYSVLKSGINMAKTEEEMSKIKTYANRVVNFIGIINAWLKCEGNDYIYWIEKEKLKNTYRITLKITPLDIAQEMQEKVYSVYDKIVFTSATLAIKDNFEFFKKSVGLIPKIIDHSSIEEIILPTPFDYESNVIIYLPESVPDPKNEEQQYKIVCSEIIKEMIELTYGNTFVLFTSFDLMNWVYEKINSNGAVKYKIFIQDESKTKLLKKFHSTENSVLFGVDTFWQGVDIPGEKLVSIIIPRLPFDVPEHPVVEAKVEKIRSEGGDPFREYLLPNAIMKLKQGFGRLIRKNTDWGIVTIIDPRIKIRWYGRYFINSLPKCQITTDFDVVKKFFMKKKGKIL